MTYASLTQVKSAMRIGAADTVDDAALTLALAAADEAIDVYCGRHFATAGTASTRTYAAGKYDVVEIDDATTITAVEYSRDGSTWNATTDYQAEPLNGTTDGIAFPYTRLRATGTFAWPVYNGLQTVRVTGTFAFGYVPSSVVQAAVLQAVRWFKRPDAPFGVAGISDVGVLRVTRNVDPDVAVLLMPYRKVREAV